MLQSVRVTRFKSIADVEIPLGRTTLLVGPNNAGKSSVLHAIQFAVSVAQSLRLDDVSSWSNTGISGTLSAQQLVYTPLRDVQALAAGGILRQDEAQAIKVVMVTDDMGSAEVTVRRGRNKNISVNIEGKDLGRRIEDLEQPYSVVAPGLAGIPSFEEFRSAGIVRRAAAKGDANGVFRNILWLLKQNQESWAVFQSNIQRIFPQLSIEVEFDSSIDEYISATVIRDDVKLPIDSCGTGVLQAIQTLAYIGVYRPKLLILDEPDSHLHPDNQRKLARLLDELAAADNFQILISTHSRHFLDEFSSIDATVHWFSGGKIQADNLDRVSVLLGLGALDAGDRLRNGATPYIVLTEDSDYSLLKKILAASGLGEDKCEIWPYAGCTNQAAALILSQFIRDHAPATKVIVHRDRDYLSDDEALSYSQSLMEVGIHPFITSGTDVESHFINADHLAAVAQPLTVEQIQVMIEAATVATAAKSIEKFINSRVMAAQHQRNKGQIKEINHGKIALDAQNAYEGNPQRFRHAKSVIGPLISAIQMELKRNIQPVQESEFLAVPTLAALVE